MNPHLIASIVYCSAFVPLCLILVFSLRKNIPKWIWQVYIITFVICAIGWEIWFTYGLWNGQSVELRRSPELNLLIPQNINWILNSLADAGIVLSGICFVWLFSQNKKSIFNKWSWKEMTIITIFFLSQNLIVELYIYQSQLAEGLDLSWAPLAFTSTWFNPTLFNIGDKTVQLQTQLPWFIMTPLSYWYIRKCKKVD